jgi:hypothetical protein
MRWPSPARGAALAPTLCRYRNRAADAKRMRSGGLDKYFYSYGIEIPQYWSMKLDNMEVLNRRNIAYPWVII